MQGRSNAQTLFGMHQIPTDHQIRILLDPTDPMRLRSLFFYLFNGLNEAGIIDAYRCVNQTILIAFDGTEYFSSSAIHCPHCSTRTHANGQVTYFHTVLTPVVVKPGEDKVIPLPPEFVRPHDGAAKQDGEINAAKRWRAACGGQYSPLGATILGDDLYSHEPFCRAVLDANLNFILVASPPRIPSPTNGSSFSNAVVPYARGSGPAGPVASAKPIPIAMRKPSRYATTMTR